MMPIEELEGMLSVTCCRREEMSPNYQNVSYIEYVGELPVVCCRAVPSVASCG